VTDILEQASASKVFAQNLLRLRRDQKLSFDQLANNSGVSRAMLQQIEKGRSVPTIDVADRIASGLAVRLCQMLKPVNDVAET
jgi:XRE family transcriptional regulator, regulator of sulfur utilization